MKLIVQRVLRAKVEVDNKIVGKIRGGLFVLVGIKKGDTTKDANELIRKLLKLRLMADEKGKMNLSVNDTPSEILVVSQFTLYGDTKEGNRPSFINAEEPEKAKEIYEYFIRELRNGGVKIETGIFGEYMKIETELDGPVTLVLEN